MEKIRSVLLLGAECGLALSVVRSLGKELPAAKLHTYSPLQKSIPPAMRSRFVDSSHYFEDWSDPFFHIKLENMVRQTSADVIIPISGEAVYKLTTLKQFAHGISRLPPLPSPALHRQLEDKLLLCKLQGEIGMPYARTWPLRSSIVPVIDASEFPLLLKPRAGSSGLGILKISDERQLMQALQKLDGEEYLLQEIIPGDEIGCSILAINGEIRAFTIQQVLGNKGFGVATAIRFIQHDGILQQTEHLIRQTGYSGLAHLDFRVDNRDGKPRLLDFNARFWHSLRGSKAAGIDFALLYCMAAMGPIGNSYPYKNITYYLGRDSLRYYLNAMLPAKSSSEIIKPVYTDLWDRIGDPFPEFARYIS